MSWTFRRRIKIADGVQLNLSRGGLSLTLGPRGARVTLSPKAMYLHLGLPGTGIYSRRGVNFNAEKKRRAKLARQRQIQRSQSGDFIDALERANETLDRWNAKLDASNEKRRQEKPKNGPNGCLLFFLWLLLLASAFMVFVCVVVLFSDGLDEGGIVVGIFFAALTLLFAHLIRRAKLKGKALRRGKHGKLELIPDDFMKGLSAQIKVCKNELKKPILENFLAKAIREQADNELRPLIDECLLKLDKGPSTRVQAKMNEYQELLDKRYAAAAELVHDFIGELSEEEKKRYEEFCSSYQVLLSSKKKWLIEEEEEVTNQKSSSDTLITTSELSFGVGDFWAVDIPYEYPTIPVSEYIRFCFFPRCVVEEDLRYYGEFKVYSIKDIILLYEECRFNETEEVPEDAELIETTYAYANKDGSPDLRYSENPMVNVVMYGNISIMPFDHTLQFSNNAATKAFTDAYVRLAAAAPDTLELGDYASAKKVAKSNRVKANKDKEKKSVPLDDIHPLFEIAARTVVLNQRGSVPDLQRKLGIGYQDALEILHQLEVAGIVGPQVGSIPRKVLVGDLAILDDILQEMH